MKKHNHTDGCNHSHNNKVTIALYFIGLLSFIIAKIITNSFISNSLYILTIIISGYHVIIEGFADTYKNSKNLKKFHPNVHVLMALATIGASFIGEFSEGALLIIIFSGANFLEEYAEARSKKEITNLLNLNPTMARRITKGDEFELVEVSKLKIDDYLKILNGDQIPADGIITEGVAVLDEATITGESIPKEKIINDFVYASTMNGNSSFIMKITKDPQDSVFAKIIEMVNTSQKNHSKTTTYIKKLEPKYVTTVLLLVPIFMILGNIFLNWSISESFYRGMVFLVGASPCALIASSISATLSAISNLAKHGILFKGGSFLSNLSLINTVAFDKTGTLTTGKPEVTDTYFIKRVTKIKQNEYLEILTAMEKSSNHPLATAIINKYPMTKVSKLEVTNNIGVGLETDYQNKKYSVTKKLDHYNLTNDTKKIYEKLMSEGKTVVFFLEDEQLIFLIALLDQERKDAKELITYLNNNHIETVMITGDNEKTAKKIAHNLKILTVIANVLPENKKSVIEKLQESNKTVVMVGDGVNDALALTAADIGFAMGNGTDIAIDVCDAVIMNDDLKKIIYAHKVSKKLNRIIWQNIIFSMIVVLVLILMNIFGKMDLPIGVLLHETSTILVLFNSLRLLFRIK